MKTEKYKINDEILALSEGADLFICCSSFESRCLTIPEKLNKGDVKNIAICVSKNAPDTINTEKLKGIFNDCKPTIILTNPEEPYDTLTQIQNYISNFLIDNNDVSVVVDITTFTHENLLILYKILDLNLDKIKKLVLCYNDAGEYSINSNTEEDKWLSKGVGDIRNVIGYPGYLTPARKTHLVILFGFEVERTLRIIDQFEADIVSIGVGSTKQSICDRHCDINYKRFKELQENYPSLESFEFSLTNPVDTAESIKAQMKKFPDTNVIISPMNTKLSTIGAAIVTKHDDDVQLCYIRANLYNKDGYSTPGEHIYTYQVKY